MDMEHGIFCWNELVTPDPEKAGKFYRDLIGWSQRDMDMGPMGTYMIFQKNNKEAGGMMRTPPGEDIPCAWYSYLTVDDVDDCAARVPELGGQVVHEPFDIPDVGRICRVMDPTGAVIMLMTPAKKE